jgi:hypothetical protein
MMGSFLVPQFNRFQYPGNAEPISAHGILAAGTFLIETLVWLVGGDQNGERIMQAVVAENNWAMVLTRQAHISAAE